VTPVAKKGAQSPSTYAHIREMEGSDFHDTLTRQRKNTCAHTTALLQARKQQTVFFLKLF